MYGYPFPPYMQPPQQPIIWLPGQQTPQQVDSLKDVKSILKLIQKEELKKKEGDKDKKKDDKPKATTFSLGQVVLILSATSWFVGPITAVMMYSMWKWMVASIPILQ